MATVELIAACVSIIGAIFILALLPNVIGQLMSNIPVEKKYGNFLQVHEKQALMALGVVLLMTGRFGANLAQNDLSNAQIIYGSLITAAAIAFIGFLTFSKQPYQFKKDNSYADKITGAVYSGSVLIVGLIIILINQFIIF